MKFKYFEREDGLKTNMIITYAGFLGAPEEMEDVELKLIINDDNEMEVEIENKHYYNDDEIQELNLHITQLNWENSFDIDFVNLLGVEIEPTYKLKKL